MDPRFQHAAYNVTITPNAHTTGLATGIEFMFHVSEPIAKSNLVALGSRVHNHFFVPT